MLNANEKWSDGVGFNDQVSVRCPIQLYHNNNNNISDAEDVIVGIIGINIITFIISVKIASEKSVCVSVCTLSLNSSMMRGGYALRIVSRLQIWADNVYNW